MACPRLGKLGHCGHDRCLALELGCSPGLAPRQLCCDNWRLVPCRVRPSCCLIGWSILTTCPHLQPFPSSSPSYLHAYDPCSHHARDSAFPGFNRSLRPDPRRYQVPRLAHHWSAYASILLATIHAGRQRRCHDASWLYGDRHQHAQQICFGLCRAHGRPVLSEC